MPIPARGLGKTKKKWIFQKPTMHEKLKNLEFEMDPGRQKALAKSLNSFSGVGTTDNVWERGRTRPPPDPDVGAMAGTRRGLTPIKFGILAKKNR
jgi:hypothetical protein